MRYKSKLYTWFWHENRYMFLYSICRTKFNKEHLLRYSSTYNHVISIIKKNNHTVPQLRF